MKRSFGEVIVIKDSVFTSATTNSAAEHQQDPLHWQSEFGEVCCCQRQGCPCVGRKDKISF